MGGGGRDFVRGDFVQGGYCPDTTRIDAYYKLSI